MEKISEQCWTRIESLRYRVKSICSEADKDELASIDTEMVELREIVFTALRALENEVRPTRQPLGEPAALSAQLGH